MNKARKTNTTTPSARGEYAEQQAKNYLCKQGLVFIEQNFACKLGEIDLIFTHASTLVFVEVRYRKSAAFGGAAASVSNGKQRKIKNAAKLYLVSKNIYEKRAVRFDVMAITGQNIQWIQGAF